MKDFGTRTRKLALTIHVICCGTWLGAAVAMMTLILWRGREADSDSAFSTTWQAIKTIDDLVIIAAAGSSFVTGCVLSWGTKWGFFKWYWIITKLVTTTLMVAFGAFCLGPWINIAAQLSAEQGVHATNTPRFQNIYFLVSVFGTLQVLVLFAVFAISIFKPWGKLQKRIPRSPRSVVSGS